MTIIIIIMIKKILVLIIGSPFMGMILQRMWWASMGRCISGSHREDDLCKGRRGQVLLHQRQELVVQHLGSLVGAPVDLQEGHPKLNLKSSISRGAKVGLAESDTPSH